MIKITRISGKGDDVTQLRVEGRILQKTTDELERACLPALAGRSPLLLDLGGVSFMDPEGANAIQALVGRGAVVIGCSPFVSEILRSCGPANVVHVDVTTDDARADAELVDRLRRNDDRAFEEMTRRYGGRMLAVARRLLRNEEDARDVVQDSFISAFKALDSFQGNARVSTWLHRIVVNTALMRLRSKRRRPEESIDELLPRFDESGEWASEVTPLGAPDDEVDRREVRQIVRRCIDLLPEAYRAIVLLRDIEEMDTEETASALGMSVSAVKSRLHRARQALRTLLERQLGDVPKTSPNDPEPSGRSARGQAKLDDSSFEEPEYQVAS